MLCESPDQSILIQDACLLKPVRPVIFFLFWPLCHQHFFLPMNCDVIRWMFRLINGPRFTLYGFQDKLPSYKWMWTLSCVKTWWFLMSWPRASRERSFGFATHFMLISCNEEVNLHEWWSERLYSMDYFGSIWNIQVVKVLVSYASSFIMVPKNYSKINPRKIITRWGCEWSSTQAPWFQSKRESVQDLIHPSLQAIQLISVNESSHWSWDSHVPNIKEFCMKYFTNM